MRCGSPDPIRYFARSEPTILPAPGTDPHLRSCPLPRAQRSERRTPRCGCRGDPHHPQRTKTRSNRRQLLAAAPLCSHPFRCPPKPPMRTSALVSSRSEPTTLAALDPIHALDSHLCWASYLLPGSIRTPARSQGGCAAHDAKRETRTTRRRIRRSTRSAHERAGVILAHPIGSGTSDKECWSTADGLPNQAAL